MTEPQIKPAKEWALELFVAPLRKESPEAWQRCDKINANVVAQIQAEAIEACRKIAAVGVDMTLKFTRVWAMPSADTFDVQPIGDMVKRYLVASKVSCDPFARNKRWATHTNDLNPKTAAEHHMDACDFLRMIASDGIRCDLAILDPPYSPRQISECYQEAGIKCGMKETQNAALYSRVKNSLAKTLTNDATILSFRWNSAGMGQKHGCELIEIMLVCHGGAHNDTICLAERPRSQP